MLSLKGRIVKVEEPRQGDKWASREFVVEETVDKYPQKGRFKIFKKGEYIDYALDKFPSVGSEVEVTFNLRLAEGQSKKTGNPYSIQELNVFRINVISQGSGKPDNDPFEEEESDLPWYG